MFKKRYKIPTFFQRGYFLLALLLLFITINTAQAAQLYFAPENLDVGINQIFKVSLMLDPENQSINALEGKITFDQNYFELIEILEGDSVVNLWIVKPQFSCTESCGIIFSGIIPGGFAGLVSWEYPEQRPGNVFDVVLKAKNISEQQINLANVKILLNDGLGTPASTNLGLLKVKILETPTAAYQLPADNLPPENFQPTINTNPKIFNGQYFLTFDTQDKGTGIDHYEVSEGEKPFKKTTSPYLLKYQRLNKEIKIKAIDKAGNEKLVTLPPQRITKGLENYWIPIIIVLTLIVATFLCYKLLRKLKWISKTKNN